MSSRCTAPCFPERMRHKAVMEILSRLSPAIGSCGACFGGGTYCSLICGEYRRSDDIDFLCSDPEGYSRLRTLVGEGFFDGIPVLRIRDDRYAIRCLLAFEGMKIKFEIVAETDVNVTPVHDERFPVPVMDPLELAAVKPLANADRWHDQAMNSRDFLDFGMLLHTHTPQPEDVLEKIAERHFPVVIRGLEGALGMLANKTFFHKIVSDMEMRMEDIARARVCGKRFLGYFREMLSTAPEKAGLENRPS